MTSLGAASIELSLDRSRFDRDLAQLANENAPSFTPQLKLDIKDFNQQVLGLQGFIPTLSVPVTLDTTSIRTADVRRQFSDIGRNAALGFAEGFAGADKGIESTIDSLVKNTKSQLEIQSPSRVFRQIGKYAADGLVQGLSDIDEAKLKSTVDKLEDYFKKSKVSLDLEFNTKSAKNGFGGQKISLDLDTSSFTKAIEKGFKDATKKNPIESLIGGLLKSVVGLGTGAIGLLLLPIKAAAIATTTIFTGAGQRIGEKLSEGVTDGFNAAIKNAVSRSLGGSAVIGEALGEGIVKSLGVTVDALFPGVIRKIGEQSKQLIGEKRVTSAAAINRAQTTSTKESDRTLAVTQLQKEFQSSVSSGLPQRARELKAEIDAKNPQLEKDTAAFATNFAQTQKRLQEEAKKIQITLTPEKLIERRVKDYDEQVKQYEAAIATLEKQGDKSRAATFKQSLAQLKSPNTDTSKITDKELTFYENLYQSQAQNQYVAKGLAPLSEQRQELTQRHRELAPLKQEYNAIALGLGGTSRGLEVLGGAPQVTTARQQITEPRVYQNLFKEVANLSNVSLEKATIPRLAISESLRPGTFGNYNPEANQISVSKEAYQLIQAGKLNAKEIETLVHELRHAVQFDFGKTDVNTAAPAIPLLSPNPQETRELGRRIESSVEIQKPELQPITRKLEADAYVFAARNAPRLQQQVEKDEATQSLESSFGIGGSKAELLVKRSQKEVLGRILKISQLAEQYGVDIGQEVQSSVAQLDSIVASLTPILSVAANIEPLTAKEINKVQSVIESTLSKTLESLAGEPDKVKAILSEKLTSLKQATPATPLINPKELEANLNRLNLADVKAIAKQLNVSTYNSDTQKSFNKAGLIQQVVKTADPLELQKALPSISKPSPELLAQAQEFVSLPLPQIKEILTEQGTQIREGLKSSLKQKGSQKAESVTQILTEIHETEDLISQALSQNLEESVRNELEGFRLRLTKSKYQAKGQLGQVALETSQQSPSRRVPTVGQAAATNGNSFDLAISEDIENAIATAKAQVLKLVSRAKNGAANSSAYGDFYSRQIAAPIKGLEAEAKKAEAAAGAAAAQTQKELDVANRLLERATGEKEQLEKINARLGELELVNQADPSIAANLAIADAKKSRQRRQNTINEIRRNPIQFAQQRTRNATVQKARYITENAEGIANIIGTKVGDEPSLSQAKSLVELQQRFGDLGEAATKFGQKNSAKNFKELDIAVKSLEKNLKELGLPFSQINKEIDIYVNNLKKMQGEGKVSVGVDVESLAPQKFSFLDNVLSKLSGVEAKGLQVVGGLVKGFLAFNGLFFLQNLLTQITTDAFKAYVEFDKLKTALNFASGGSAGGANNLDFVKKQVDDLAIPLEASVKGFTQLAGAARGTALEGQQTKELFLGISQASTVLSLSADDTTGAIGALEKILSEGKVSSEALRLELADRIPGAFAIAARSMGTTEEEFTRLLETGQVLSQDFLPKFGKQLQSEFGEASKTASDNAQSAIFKLQNSWLSLQQSVGEGAAPVVIPGLKLLSGTLSVVADHIKDLMAITASAALVMSFNLANALKTVIKNLILTNAATGTLGGGFQFLAQAVNNSLSLKIGAAIFGVIEIIKLLNDQVNTELVKSFDEAADAATRAAEASEKAFSKKPGSSNQEKDDNPRATSDTGRFVDNYLINPANFVLQHTFTDIPKFATTGESEKTRVLDSNQLQQQATTSLLAGARLREAEIKKQQGDIGQLPALDKNLRDRSLQQQILQAQAKRDYTDKGLAVPATIQTRLTQESFQINQLNNKRADIAQPYNETLAALNQGITRYKSQLEGLKDQKTIDNLGATKIDELTKKYNQNIEALLKQKNSLEATLAAYNINPILKFNDAYRKLNLTLNETTEANQIVTTKREISSAQTRLQGFSSNRLAGRQSALTDAITARDSASADAQNQQKILDALNKEARSPALQPQLQRLGITPDSSVAKIQDILSNTKDESDKALLEKIKSVREQEVKTLGAKKVSVESQEKVKQVTQDNALSELQFGVGGATAAIQKRENLNTAAVRKAQEDRTISESKAAEKVARIQLNSTSSQQKSIAIQLRLLNEYHRQGIVGAEEFATRQRDLTTEQTNLQKQSAEQQLAVFEAVNRRKLEQLELANKKAEAAIALSQTLATTGVKQGVLGGTLDTIEAPRQQNLIEQQASLQRIEFIKTEIAQTKQLQVDKVISAKESTEKQLDLNQQLAAANQQLVDQQIQAQEQLRAAIEKTFQRRKEQSELQISQATTNVQRGYLEQFSAPQIDERGLDLARTGVTLNNSSVSDSRQIGLLQEQLAGIDKLGYAEKDAADKKRSLLSEIEKLRQQQIQTEIDLIKNKEEIEINAVERVQKVEENRFKLASSNLEQQKSSLELYTASLDRTSKLEESRNNLQKAVSDAGLSGLDIRKDSANRALELSRRVKNDANLDPKVASEINRQLNQAGFGTNELDILKKRQQIEDEIASKKLAALQIEQEFQRKSLVLDLKRQQIAAQTAVYDAESAQIAASKSKLEADNALRIAQIKRDPVEIQIAKVGVELADRDIDLSDRKLQNAKDNLGIQDELARNSVMAQEATQRSAIDQQLAADSARKQAGALERVEASVSKMNAESKADSKADEAAADIFKQKPGEGLFDYNLRINKAKTFGQILEKKDSRYDVGGGFTLTPETFTAASDTGAISSQSNLSLMPSKPLVIPNTKDTVSEAVANSKIKVASTSSGYDQFADALRAANKGIESRLDKLLDSFTATMNAPKSLTVMSPSPVDDAAKIYNDMSKDMVRSSGL